MLLFVIDKYRSVTGRHFTALQLVSCLSKVNIAFIIFVQIIITRYYLKLNYLPSLQVSAEPDGSSYVFQGFIQGKDYGQFGLQRLGNHLLGLANCTK